MKPIYILVFSSVYLQLTNYNVLSTGMQIYNNYPIVFISVHVVVIIISKPQVIIA